LLVKSVLVAWFAAVFAFLVLDGIWLGIVARDFYMSRLGDLMRQPVAVAPAAAFYLCYAAGIVFLAVRPLQADVTLASVALHGAVVGFLAYGTYDMTNLATIRDWPAVVSLVDLVWGTCLTATVAVAAAIAVRQFA